MEDTAYHLIVPGLTMKEAGQSESETLQPNNENGSEQRAFITFAPFVYIRTVPGAPGSTNT